MFAQTAITILQYLYCNEWCGLRSENELANELARMLRSGNRFADWVFALSKSVKKQSFSVKKQVFSEIDFQIGSRKVANPEIDLQMLPARVAIRHAVARRARAKVQAMGRVRRWIHTYVNLVLKLEQVQGLTSLSLRRVTRWQYSILASF